MSQKWANETNWWVPPPKLVSNTIDKLVVEKARGTLIIPYWQSAPFWPIVWDGASFKEFIKTYEVLSSNAIVKGRGRNGIFGKQGSNFKMFALRIRF